MQSVEKGEENEQLIKFHPRSYLTAIFCWWAYNMLNMCYNVILVEKSETIKCLLKKHGSVCTYFHLNLNKCILGLLLCSELSRDQCYLWLSKECHQCALFMALINIFKKFSGWHYSRKDEGMKGKLTNIKFNFSKIVQLIILNFNDLSFGK